MLIQIYESEHEWTPAIAVVRELSELSGEDLKSFGGSVLLRVG